MSQPIDFGESLPKKTDADLYDMLAHKDDYLPEALAAASEELRNRNLPLEKVAELEGVAQSHKVAEGEKANERLGWAMRILIFFLCAGIAGALLGVYYDSKGFKKKASDCWITVAVSIVTHIVLGVTLTLTR